jgi:hypothetical protein
VLKKEVKSSQSLLKGDKIATKPHNPVTLPHYISFFPQSDGLIGKSYTICYGTVATGISAVEFCVAVTSKVNAAVLPQAVAQTCNKAQNNIWCRWTNLDETISFR